MGTFLSQVSDKPIIRPPRIVIHGRGKVGKTTLAASAPGAIIMPVEDGEGVLDTPHLPRPESFADVLNALKELHDEPHDYKTLVVDAIDKVEPLVWSATCEGTKYDNIEGFGYGKGYTLADAHWVKFFRWLDALRAKGMTIIVISHNETKTIEDPEIGSHVYTAPKLHKRANALLLEWADVVGCMAVERVVVEKGEGRTTRTGMTTGQRVLYLAPTGSIEAGNRYGLPAMLNIPEKNGYAVLRAEIMKGLGITEKDAA